jgi:hypothetical protein
MPSLMALTCATAVCTTIPPGGTRLLVIRRNHRTGEVSLDPLRWGLICSFLSGTIARCGAALPIRVRRRRR